jgi:hypothetical protein
VDGVNLDSKTSTLNRLLSWVDVYWHKPWKHKFSNIIYIFIIMKHWEQKQEQWNKKNENYIQKINMMNFGKPHSSSPHKMKEKARL